MYTKYNKLQPEKQSNILKASIEEFGKNTFDIASTDIIAEKSGIAKGSLFHYFGSKKNLFLFTLDYCTNFLTEIVIEKAEKIEGDDFFERIKRISLSKQETLMKYPLESKLIMDAFINTSPKIKTEVENIYIAYYTSGIKFLEEYLIKYIKLENFKENMKHEEILFFTMAILEALSKKHMEIYKNRLEELMDNTEEVFKEFDRYIELIKYGLYK